MSLIHRTAMLTGVVSNHAGRWDASWWGQSKTSSIAFKTI